MNDLIEIIEDLEMLEVLNDKDGHVEYLLKKYRERFADAEADLERQYEMFSQEVMANV